MTTPVAAQVQYTVVASAATEPGPQGVLMSKEGALHPMNGQVWIEPAVGDTDSPQNTVLPSTAMRVALGPDSRTGSGMAGSGSTSELTPSPLTHSKRLAAAMS